MIKKLAVLMLVISAFAVGCGQKTNTVDCSSKLKQAEIKMHSQGIQGPPYVAGCMGTK